MNKCKSRLKVLFFSLASFYLSSLLLTQTEHKSRWNENKHQEKTNFTTNGNQYFKRNSGMLQWRRHETPNNSALMKVEHVMALNLDKRLANIKYWNEDMRPTENLEVSHNSTKTILFYNEYRESDHYYFGEGIEPFIEAGCPVSNCFATSDRSLVLPELADAIIYHCHSPTPELPVYRSPHTRLVFYSQEPPEACNGYFRPSSTDIFNYTMTYSLSADIYEPYGMFIRRREPLKFSETKNWASGKNKTAVWFVSHCKTLGKREILVEKLKQYIEVDTYGECGNLQCPKSRNLNSEYCYKKIEKTYKFYFSFENNLCRDYVTEKFFGAARYNIVPVVYALGPIDVLAPPHSYINALDFPNVKELAEYLKYLDRNDTAYNEYFWWKKDYESLSSFKTKKPPVYNSFSWCQLCQKLHTDTQAKSYLNILETDGNSQRQCISGDSKIIKEFLME